MLFFEIFKTISGFFYAKTKDLRIIYTKNASNKNSKRYVW